MRTGKIYLLIIFTILFTTVLGTGQIKLRNIPPVIHFEHHQVNPDLISKDIRTIFQDSHGFLWLITYHDIIRYDGIRFLSMTEYMPSNITSSNIRGIYQDPVADSLIYISTHNDVLLMNLDQLLNLEKLTEVKIKKTYPVMFVSQIFKDSKQRTWLSAGAYSVSMIAPNTDSVMVVSDMNSKKYVSMGVFEDEALQRIFCITQDGQVLIYNEDLKKFERYLTLSISDVISCFKYDKSNKITWLGTSSGELIELNLFEKTYAHHTISWEGNESIAIRNLYVDHEERIWITRSGGGLARFNPRGKSVKQFRQKNDKLSSLHSNFVLSVFEDNTGLMWIGYNDGYVSHFQIQKQNIDNYELTTGSDAKPIRLLSAAYLGGNKIALSHFGGIILIAYDKKNKSYAILDEFKFPQHRIPISIFSNRRGKIWAGTLEKGSVWMMDDDFKNVHWLDIPADNSQINNIFDIMMARDSTIWISVLNNKIIRFNSKTEQFTEYFLKPDRINSVKVVVYSTIEESDTTLLVGTNQGLYRFSKTNNLFSRVNLKNDKGIIYNAEKISDIQKKPSGECVFNSSSAIYTIQPLDSVAYMQTRQIAADGYPVKSIVVDSLSAVWLISKKEIVRFDENWSETVRIGSEQGFLESNVSHRASIITPWGDLLFGRNSGLSVLRTSEVDQNQSFPKIIITDFKAFNESVIIGAMEKPNSLVKSMDFEFSYRTNIFKIEFSMIDFARTEANQFAYRMLGADNDWVTLSNNNFVTFVNLPPKNYRFELKGRNSRGYWSREPISIGIKINAPYWQTWWFWSIMVFTIFIAAWALNFQRLKRIRRRNVQLELINKELSEQISIREKMEIMLRESEEKYRAVVSSIQQEIFTCDEDGKLFFVNEVIVNRIGREANDLVGDLVTELYTDIESAKILTSITEAANSQTGLEIDLQSQMGFFAKYLHLSLQPLKSKTLQKKLLLGIVTDMSEQRRLEEELRQSQKLEAVGKLAGGIAHDFNNLIAVIRGYSDLLLSEFSGDEETLENIQEIDKASERAAVLVRQLLAFGRRQMLELQIININDIIQNLEKMLSRLIPENIELWVHRDPDIQSIYADSGQIEQVLINLLVNARDAMPNGGKLSVRTKNVNITAEDLKRYPQMIPGEYVLLEVADSGIGIPEDIKESIFEPFFTTKEKGHGTGLGLSTVFGIVKQSSGYIFVDSEPGEGTLFSVFLPRTYKNAEQESGPVYQPAQKLNGGGEAILVAEDEAGLRKMIVKMLKAQNYHVLAGANGKEALKEWRAYSGKIDLVLTDVVMPGMNGRELVEEIRKEHKDIAILYMSGYTDDQLIRQEILQQYTSYIQKPFTPQALSEKIKNVLHRSQERASKEEPAEQVKSSG